VLASIVGGISFGMLTALVVIFAYASFLIVTFLSLDIPIVFTAEQGWWFFLFIFSSLIAGIAGNKLKSIISIFTEHKYEIYELISTGRLSRLGNIHRFEVDLDDEVARSKRSKSVFPLIYIQLADPQQIQKSFGRQGQPKIMKEIGELILRITRDTDKKARVDDSTYGIILPETPQENLDVVTNKINNEIKKIRIEHKGDLVKYEPSINIGFAFFPKDGDSSVALKERAQQSLKEKKE
jgi:diguanylate cyclase (GGDEF)-like protein